jgi:hypothetical protein
MALDARLANVQLLTLAALRARERQRTQPKPGRVVVLKILYDAAPEEPPLEGATHVLYLPEKAPSAEAWYHSPLVARFRQPRPEAGEPP